MPLRDRVVRALPAFAVAALLLIAPAGAHAEYPANPNRICTTYGSKLDAVPRFHHPRGLGPYLERLLRIYRREVRALHRVSAPPARRRAYASYVAAVGGEIEMLTSARRIARAHPRAALLLVATGEPLLQRVEKRAALRAGLHACAQRAG